MTTIKELSNTRCSTEYGSIVIPYSIREVPRWIVMQCSDLKSTDELPKCRLVFECIEEGMQARTLVEIRALDNEPVFTRSGGGLVNNPTLLTIDYGVDSQ